MTSAERRSGTRPARRLVVLVAVAALVLVGVGLYALLTDDDDAGTARIIDPVAFQESFNRTVADLGDGFTLGDPVWETDERLGLDISEHQVHERALLELYRNDGGTLTAVVLLAQPAGDAERASFRALAAGIVAGGFDLSTEDALDLLDDELELDEADERNIDEEHRREGFRLHLEATISSMQLTLSQLD